MKFSWAYVENISGKSRKQKLVYRNEKKDKKENFINNNGMLNSETISLISFMKKDNNIDIKYNLYNFKYMNNFPIYALLSGQKELLINFNNNKYKSFYSKLFSKENPIITIFSPENKTLEDLKLHLKDNYNQILNKVEDSLFLDYYNKYKTNKIISSFGLLKMDLNIFFKNILITKINNFYYNRISSNEIEIRKDSRYDCILYIIPCLNKIHSILLFELNVKMKRLLIENSSNIYEVLTNFLNNIKQNKNENIKKLINIFIPSFYIETHLQEEKVSKDKLNNINRFENEEKKTSMKIASVDEFLKINFNEKKANEKQIIYEMDYSDDNNGISDNKNNIFIKNDFILGIMNNYTEIKIQMFQLMYITKDFWIKEKVESQ